MSAMTHASLFSGIGGFDLAARWMGWDNIFSCEIEEFPRKVLKHHFPNTIHYEDIRETDFTIHRGQVDVLSGGFPCQPFSIAGKRRGKNDERHLWPEMLRAIREINPRFVVGENVRGILSWSEGLVLDEVYSGLEGEGYEVLTFVLPASGINAPHKRDRVWIVAHAIDERLKGQREQPIGGRERFVKRSIYEEDAPDTVGIGHGGGAEKTRLDPSEPIGGMVQGERQDGDKVRGKAAGRGAPIADPTGHRRVGEWAPTQDEEGHPERPEHDRLMEGRPEGLCQSGDAPNADIERWEERHIPPVTGGKEFTGRADHEGEYRHQEWRDFPTQSPVCGGDDGIPQGMDERTFRRWRNRAIKAYGNAIVPQIAYRIFQTIETTDI